MSSVLLWVPVALLVAGSTYYVLALRRAKLGPQKRPEWHLTPAGGHKYDLELSGAEARDVRLEVEHPASFAEGTTTTTRCSSSARSRACSSRGDSAATVRRGCS